MMPAFSPVISTGSSRSHGHPKTVQDAGELMQDVLHNAAVA